MYPIIEIGDWSIPTYWVMQFLAYLTAIILITLEARRVRLSLIKIYFICVLIIMGGLISAKLGYFLFAYPQIIKRDPLQLILFWEGGLSIYGALIGGIIIAFISCTLLRVNFSRFADLVAPAIALGQSIGRIGCLCAGCCYGKPTRSIFGIRITDLRAVTELKNVPLHPTPLYESVGCFLLFLILWNLRKKLYRGKLFLVYLGGYVVLRFFIEFLRFDSLRIRVLGLNLRIAQVVSVIVVVLVILSLILKKERR